MKKFVSILLALVLCLSFAAAAFATDNVTASEVRTFEFTKTYVTSSGTTPATYPAETLQFNVTADEINPDDTMVTIADTTVDANPDNIVLTVPSYSKVGKYNYTISEVAGNTAGVTYATNTFNVQVFASYNTDHTAIVTEVAITTKDGEDVKVTGLTNTYDLGALDITKTVTGNMGSQDKEFNVDVTFTSTEDVKSDITYVDNGETKTIPASAMADGSETVVITVKHGETVSFTNIPYGVSYTVKEQDYTSGGVNSDNGYDAALYAVNDGTSAASDNGVTETADSAKDTVSITNNKGTAVDTGISLDNLPYILLLVVVIAAAVVLFSKKRLASNED